jgi:8-amino-7-oxononanoate synthase
MSVFPEVLGKRTQSLEADSRRRFLMRRTGIDFSSNDYLGFSNDPELKKLAYEFLPELSIGSTASRLLRGEDEIFQKIEERLAHFCSRSSALLFPSGYQANLGLLSSLLTSEDLVFSDEHNHASLIDGIRLSGAKRVIFKHSDLNSLYAALKETSKNQHGLKLIVVESLYGMGGDVAPLLSILELAEEFDCSVVVDEAHATGLWGDFENNRGGGLVQSLGMSHRVLATVHTAGKAMGVGGAWICGDSELKDYLVNFSRPFIFSTAPIPALAAFLLASLNHWNAVGITRAKEVLERADLFRKQFTKQNFDPRVQGPITPIVLGSNEKALEVAGRLQAEGFDIRAIRPPTVPAGTARLRITNHWNQTSDQVGHLSEVLNRCF